MDIFLAGQRKVESSLAGPRHPLTNSTARLQTRGVRWAISMQHSTAGACGHEGWIRHCSILSHTFVRLCCNSQEKNKNKNKQMVSCCAQRVLQLANRSLLTSRKHSNNPIRHRDLAMTTVFLSNFMRERTGYILRVAQAEEYADHDVISLRNDVDHGCSARIPRDG